jgi:hypothetical protein
LALPLLKTLAMSLKKLSDLLLGLDLDKRGKYVSKEFQAYGLMLAEELGDWKNKSLYIKLAKTTPRATLDKARYFVKDQPKGQVRNKASLFMWKLRKIKEEKELKKDENK